MAWLVNVSTSLESLGLPWCFTNANPIYLRVPRDVGKRVPYAWWETTSGNGADPEQIKPVIDIIDGMRVIRNDVVGRRQTETERTSKEEKAKHDPIVDIGLRLMPLCVRKTYNR